LIVWLALEMIDIENKKTRIIKEIEINSLPIEFLNEFLYFQDRKYVDTFILYQYNNSSDTSIRKISCRSKGSLKCLLFLAAKEEKGTLKEHLLIPFQGEHSCSTVLD
jgi:hypothetical protein